MIVVAGPPGSGKSTAFPLSAFGVDFFNADDVAAVLNGGSYLDITPEIRIQVNLRFERFIEEHIRSGTDFAIETTLRTEITFVQARNAHAAGFITIMYYVGVSSVREAIERVAIRADSGGHSAPVKVLRTIYGLSMSNLPIALRMFDHVFVFDNSAFDTAPRLLLEKSALGICLIEIGLASHRSTHARPRWIERAYKIAREIPKGV